MNSKFLSFAKVITLGISVALLPFSVHYCNQALITFCVVSLLEGKLREKIRTISGNPLALVLPAFFMLHMVGIMYSNNTINAWVNVEKKIFFFLAPLFIASTVQFTRKQIHQLLLTFVTACCLATVVCFANSIMMSTGGEALWTFGPQQPYNELHPDASKLWTFFSYTGISAGIGLHPTYFAFYLLVCILIVIGMLIIDESLSTRQQFVGIALVIYLITFITLLSSRIVIVATIISMITILVSLTPRLRLAISVAGVLVVAGLLVINPVAQYRNIQEYNQRNFSWPPAPMSDNPISIRISLLWLSVTAVKEVNPVFGSGTGDVNDEMTALSDRYNVHNVLNTSDPHNQYIHSYLALGVVGLLLLISTFLIPAWVLLRHGQVLACLGVFSFMIVCLTESALELQKGIVAFSIFTGILANQVRHFRFSLYEWKLNHIA